MTAQLDGLDPWSSNPIDKLRYLVHQSRSYHEVLRTRAICAAAIGNADKAAEALEAYDRAVLPIDPEALRIAELQREQEVEEVARMEPISLADLRFGNRIGGSGED